MFTVTQALATRADMNRTFRNIVSSLAGRFLRAIGFLNPLEPPEKLEKCDFLGVADDIDRRRYKASDNQIFLSATGFYPAQGQLVIFEGGLKAELAIAKAIEKAGDAAVESASVSARAQHGNLVQRFNADALADTGLFDAVYVRYEGRRLTGGHG